MRDKEEEEEGERKEEEVVVVTLFCPSGSLTLSGTVTQQLKSV